MLPIARRLKNCAEKTGALLIVNRRLELAKEIGADGVHLGARGPGIAGGAREKLGAAVLIGYSAHGVAEGLRALGAGADYVTLSPIFATPSKAGIFEPLGLEPLAELARQAPGRVIALGGISEENIEAVLRAGAARARPSSGRFLARRMWPASFGGCY